MPDRALPTPASAEDAFLSVVAGAGEGIQRLTATSAWQLFGLFAALPFDVPDVPDSDGLLYQYGTYSFTGERRFHLDLVRQFAVPDDDEYLQFHCDLRFASNVALDALGSHNQWWWPGEETSLDQWLAAIAARPEWQVLSGAVPVSVETSVEET